MKAAQPSWASACLTRNNAEFREAMYGLIGFKVMDHDVAFGPTVRNLLLKNPGSHP